VKWLITGTGRCGTGYVANVLQSVGFNCGHEAVFTLGGVGYAQKTMHEFDGDASWLAVPYLDDPLLADVGVVHLVRHPKAVVDSMLNMELWTSEDYSGYHLFAHNHCPEMAQWKRPADVATAFCHNWCAKIAPNIVWHIEDDVRGLLDLMRIPFRHVVRLFDDKQFNTRPGDSDVRLTDLPPVLQKKMVTLCERYGYDSWE